MKPIIRSLSVLALALWSAPVFAQQGYQKPPQEVLDVLNAPLPPSPFRSPDNREVVFAQWVRYPAIADLAQPMLRLAGVRINPRTNGQSSNRTYITGLSVKALPNGAERPITLPADVRLGAGAVPVGDRFDQHECQVPLGVSARQRALPRLHR